MKYINIPVFLISLVLGAFFIYVSAEPTETILVYPTPENAQILQYQDKADNCFQYSMEKVKCPSNKSKINHIPIQ